MTPQGRAREIPLLPADYSRLCFGCTEDVTCGVHLAIANALTREREKATREERERWTRFLGDRVTEETEEASDRSSGEDYRRMHRYVATHLKSWVAALRAGDATPPAVSET